MSPEEAKSLAKGYPQEMHFLGGPYDGTILRPHIESITDVHRQLDHALIPLSDLPINFFPVNEGEIVLKGPAGFVWYKRDEQHRWVFVGWAEVEGETEVE